MIRQFLIKKIITMSIGFADYLVVQAMILDRDLMRDLLGIEVPLFRNEFENWLMENYKEGTRTNYMRHLRQADEWSIYFENDFWMNLHRAWKASDFSKVKNLCKEHESSFEKDRKAAEKHKESVS